MMSVSGSEVVHIQIGTKNKINKNTHRETEWRGGTQQKNAFEKLERARTVSIHCMHTSLLTVSPAHT